MSMQIVIDTFAATCYQSRWLRWPRGGSVQEDIQLEGLAKRIEAIKAEIMRIDVVLPGSVVERLVTCGRTGCACQTNPPTLHGPYLEWTRTEKGKTRSTRITEERAAYCRQWIAAGRSLQELIDEWLAVGVEAFSDLDRELERRKEATRRCELGASFDPETAWAGLLKLAREERTIETLGKKWPNRIFFIDEQTIGIERLRSRGGAPRGTGVLNKAQFIERWRVLVRDTNANAENWPWTLSVVWSLVAHLPNVEFRGAFDLRLVDPPSHELGTTRRYEPRS
jgi:hypothetical protein